MHGTMETQKLPANQPRCSKFVAHYKISVDRADLNLQDIGNLRLRSGEMIVIFAWAYYQGHNTGPNITESLPGGSKL